MNTTLTKYQDAYNAALVFLAGGVIDGAHVRGKFEGRFDLFRIKKALDDTGSTAAAIERLEAESTGGSRNIPPPGDFRGLGNSAAELMTFSVKELKEALATCGVTDLRGCTEKRELVDLLRGGKPR